MLPHHKASQLHGGRRGQKGWQAPDLSCATQSVIWSYWGTHGADQYQNPLLNIPTTRSEPFVKNVPTKSQKFEFLPAEQTTLTMACKELWGPESWLMFTRTRCCPSSAMTKGRPACSLQTTTRTLEDNSPHSPVCLKIMGVEELVETYKSAGCKAALVLRARATLQKTWLWFPAPTCGS